MIASRSYNACMVLNSPCSHRILLVAHAPLAGALQSAAAHVLREETSLHVVAVDVLAHDPIRQTSQRIAAMLEVRAPVLILVDIMGASPFNAAVRASHGLPHVRIVTGVNLPMLLRALTYCQSELDVWAERAISGAHQGVVNLSCLENSPLPLAQTHP